MEQFEGWISSTPDTKDLALNDFVTNDLKEHIKYRHNFFCY